MRGGTQPRLQAWQRPSNAGGGTFAGVLCCVELPFDTAISHSENPRMFKLDGPTLRRALQAHFDTSTLAKGRVYQQQQRVLDCTVAGAPEDGLSITAVVRGSQPKPYEINVDVFDTEGVITIEGECSCPME